MGGSYSRRYNLSVNSRKVDLEEFDAKLDRLLKHYDIRKGDYTGNYNISGLFIQLVKEEYKRAFGDDDPNNPTPKQWDLIDVDYVRDALKQKFGNKTKKYDSRVLYRQMRDFILNILYQMEDGYSSEKRIEDKKTEILENETGEEEKKMLEERGLF